MTGKEFISTVCMLVKYLETVHQTIIKLVNARDSEA